MQHNKSGIIKAIAKSEGLTLTDAKEIIENIINDYAHIRSKKTLFTPAESSLTENQILGNIKAKYISKKKQLLADKEIAEKEIIIQTKILKQLDSSIAKIDRMFKI